jgi:hypothetical protein
MQPIVLDGHLKLPTFPHAESSFNLGFWWSNEDSDLASYRLIFFIEGPKGVPYR